MDNKIILISKDACRPEYLSCYGSNIYDTPNIDYLAQSGTMFNNYYAVAPSTAMSFMGMFTGLYPHQLKDRKDYKTVSKFNLVKTLFDRFEEKEYKNYIIWDESWVKLAKIFTEVYGDKPEFSNLLLSNSIKGNTRIKRQNTFNEIININDIVEKIDYIYKKNEKSFVWLHVPHVLYGAKGYGADIQIFDELVGKLIEIYPRDSIFLTADHGHMDFKKGIPVYGFHLYEPAIKIPLITPQIEQSIEDRLLNNTILPNLLLEEEIDIPEFIYSDTQYYAQSNRKIMIRKGKYKYIFNKSTKAQELYDLEYDKNEEINLLIDHIYDLNRNRFYFLDEIHNYPDWKNAEDAYYTLREEFFRIWEKGNIFEEFVGKLKPTLKKMQGLFPVLFSKRLMNRGRWGATIKQRKYDT